MPRKIEIKARIESVAALRPLATPSPTTDRRPTSALESLREPLSGR